MLENGNIQQESQTETGFNIHDVDMTKKTKFSKMIHLETIDIEFSSRSLVMLRLSMGMTQQELADKLEVKRSYIATLETGQRTKASHRILMGLEDTYNVRFIIKVKRM